MARLPRLALAGHAHYLIQRSVHGQPLVLDEADQHQLLAALGESARTHHVVLWAFAIGDEELHLLACPASDGALGRMMQALARRYVSGFNRRHQRRGALWGARFKAAIVEDGEAVLAAMLMIDGLPDQRQSSAPHHLGQWRDPLLADAPVLWGLGNTPFERELNYRKALAQGVATDVATRIQAAVDGGWAFGSPAFAAAVAAASARPVAPRPRGRTRLPNAP